MAVVVDSSVLNKPIQSDVELGEVNHTAKALNVSTGDDLKGILGELDFKPNFKIVASRAEKANLSWENIYYNIGSKKILNNVCGHVNSGELCAIIGPSGAGKTTLLNILAGRVNSYGAQVVSGKIKVNDSIIESSTYKKNIAYVTQEDALYAQSTVRETLEFSANLRLPSSVSPKEKQELIDDLINSLGLKKCENTYIGDSLFRGVSGGEKKRASIGAEMVTNPVILFLDEPTSGLDSYSAWKVVKILQCLARAGCAILCTIHQPSSEVFDLFDTVNILAPGKLIYNGPVKELGMNFALHGFKFASGNPADYVMLLTQTVSVDKLPSINDDDISSASSPTSAAMDRRKSASMMNIASSGLSAPATALKVTRTSGFWTQLYYLSKREFLGTTRNKIGLFFRFFITIFLNLLFGLIFYQNANPNSTGYTPGTHFGAIVQIVISAFFGASQPPLLTFPLERVIFLREYATGTYGAFPYLFSKLMVEIPLGFLVTLSIYLVGYWLFGLQGSFIMLVLATWLLQVVSASYAYLMGAFVETAKTAQELSPLIFVPQLLFSGFFIKISQIPVYLRWIQYVCTLKYGLDLVMLIEFDAALYTCDPNNSNYGTCMGNAAALKEIMTANDVNADQVGLYIGVMLGIFFVFRFLSVLGLIARAKNLPVSLVIKNMILCR